MSSNDTAKASALQHLKRSQANRRVPQPPPKHSAARSHEANDQYMDDWDQAYAQLEAASGRVPQSSKGSSGGTSSSTSSRKKWVPPAEGWQDTLPPEPQAPPPAHRTHQVPNELDQLHALSQNKFRGPGPGLSTRSRAPTVARRTTRSAGAARLCKFPESVVPAFAFGPSEPQGIMADISDRPSICSSVDWAAGEAVIGSSDHALYGIDVETGRVRRTLYTKKYGHTEWVTCVTHTSDGKVVSGGMDSKLCLWPAHGNTCQTLDGHHGSISQVKLDQSSGMVVSAGYDKTLRVWDVGGSRGRMNCSLEGHAAPVLELETGPSSTILSGDRSGHILLWDLATGAHSWRLKNVHRGHITSLAWWGGADGGSDLFMSGGQDGCLRVWDTREHSCLHTLELHVNDHGVGALSDIIPPMAATAHKCITAGADGVVRILEPRMGFEELHIIPVTNFVYSCIAAGGLALVGCGDGALHVIDIESGAINYALGANQAAVRTIDASNDTLLCSGDDGNVMIYKY